MHYASAGIQAPTNPEGFPALAPIPVAGWIPKDLVDNIPSDCAARIARAKWRKPLRLLIPVGGAGAHKT